MRGFVDRRAVLGGLAAASVFGASGRRGSAAAPDAVVVEDALAGILRGTGLTGTFAVRHAQSGRVLATDAERVRQGFLPASTFKVPNSLIALQTGVVTDVDAVTFNWDGKVRDIAAWNQDHSLRSAFKASAVPVYQEIARRIGAETMQRFVSTFAYGNRDISGAPIDRFWLNGNLRTSALEQIEFLTKLERGELPVAPAHQDTVKDMMLLETSDLGTLRGKTGAVGIGLSDGAKATLGWLVGWLERGRDRFIFALNIDVREPADLAQRMPLAKALLAKAAAI